MNPGTPNTSARDGNRRCELLTVSCNHVMGYVIGNWARTEPRTDRNALALTCSASYMPGMHGAGRFLPNWYPSLEKNDFWPLRAPGELL